MSPISNLKLKILAILIGTAVGLGLAGEARAADHFFNPNCANNGNGHSPGCGAAGTAGAWNDASFMNNHAYAVGDDVYIRDAVTISGVVIKPGISGSADNQAILGSYYNDSGAVGKPQGGAIINGNNTVPSNDAQAPIVAFSNKNYITIQDLKVINSGSRGIQIQGGIGNKITGNYLDTTWDNGIQIMYLSTAVPSCPDDFEISHNEVHRTNQRHAGGAINVVGRGASQCTTSGVVKNNLVINSANEGIDIIKGAPQTIIENNTVINSENPNIYLDRNARNNTIRHNLIYGYAGQPADTNAAIAIQDEQWETYAGCQGNKIHSNKIVNARQCLALNAQHPESIFKDNKIFNNTCIDSGHATDSYRGANFASWDISPAENSHIKNNISWITEDPFYGTYAKHSRFVSLPNGVTFSTNLFNSSATVEASVKSPTDPGYPSYPTLATSGYFQKGSGWKSIASGSLTGNEFNLKSTATQAIDKGEWLTTVASTQGSGNSFAVASQYFTAGDKIQFQNSQNSMTVVSVNNLSVTVDRSVSWTQGLGVALDYEGTKPDIGAYEYTAGDTTAPRAPGGLSVW